MKKLLLLLALTFTLVPVYAQELSQTRSMSDKYKKIYYTSIDDDNFSMSCVDNLEALTGIDFFAEQVDDFEKQVKATYNLRNWGL